MTWMPWAILSGLALEAINAWIERHAVHVAENEVHPPFRLWQYGTRWSYGPEYIVRWPIEKRWFFLLKLPSWQWGKLDYGRRMGWMQLVLVWESDKGWSQSGYWPQP